MKKYFLPAFIIIIVVVLIWFYVNKSEISSQATEEGPVAALENSVKNQPVGAKSSETMDKTPATQPVLDPKYSEAQQAIIKTNKGDITVEFYRQESPATVNNFLTLAGSEFYNGVKFHRVIKQFMIQSGDPLSKDDTRPELWGTGGPDYTFADEINDHKLLRGSLAMANRGPDTNGSQFFIVTAEATPWLDGLHTNFGQVVMGMDVVEAIAQTPTAGPDRPVEPVVIESIELR